MQDQVNAPPTPHKRVLWNKGKVTGAKPALRSKHIWSIRTKLQIERRTRDLAMFNLAIDSKLRRQDQGGGCRCERTHGGPRCGPTEEDRGRPVRFELGEQIRQALAQA